MKTYTFPTGGSFGNGDTWEGIFDFTSTDEEAARLEASARKEPRSWMEEDPEISDIREKVKEAAYEDNIRTLVEDKSFVKEQREWYEDENEEEGVSDRAIIEWYMDGTSFDIMYPQELQDLESEEEE